ncbi:hypothetical protein K1I81_06280 [Streptococcus sanguinis]|uniref:hypothetical protein n=3 Tax=Streptococcus sanguinis TaxID=1305 RepID=UPI001CBA91A6|nr:hypothetical protein [Streptococcus sanguinis]MBZ2068665.1 hypothetical protein [Streptococcus sanguinis]
MKKRLLFFLILLISIFIGIGQVRADSSDSDSFSDSSSFSSSNDSDSDDASSSDLGSGLSADADDLGHFSSDSDDDTSDDDGSSDLGSGLSADADDLGDFSTDSAGDNLTTSDSSTDLGSGLTVNPDSLGDFASDIPTIDSLDASANDGDNLTNLGNVSTPVSTESTNPTTSTDEIMGGTPDAAVATAPAPLTDATNSDTTIDETTASSTPIDSANQTTDSIDSASSDKPNSMDSAVESNTADSAGNGLTANPDSLGSFVSDKPADRTGSESSTDLGSGLTADADSLGSFISESDSTTDSIDSASSDKPNLANSAETESNTAASAGNGLTANPDSLGSFVSDKPADRTGSESSIDLGSGLTGDSNETVNVLGNSAWGDYSPLEADYTVSTTNTTNAGERRNPNMWGTETGKPFSTPTTALGIVGEEVYDVFDGMLGKLAGVTFTELGTYVTPDPQPVPEEVLTPIGSLNYNIAQGTSPVLGTGVIRTSETGARYIGIIADNLTHNVANNVYIGLTGETLSGTDAVPDSSPLPESVGRIAIIANNIVGSKTDVEPLDVVIGATGYNPITGENEDRVPSLFGIIQGMRGGQKEGSEGASNSQEK